MTKNRAAKAVQVTHPIAQWWWARAILSQTEAVSMRVLDLHSNLHKSGVQDVLKELFQLFDSAYIQ